MGLKIRRNNLYSWFFDQLWWKSNFV